MLININNNKMLSTRIRISLHKELKYLSFDTDKSISELTEEAIQDLLKKHEKKIRNKDFSHGR